MRASRVLVSLTVAVALAGCGTYNFAPPNVEMDKVAKEGAGFNTQCKIHPTDDQLTHSIAGASDLINNFLYAYRCAARQVANGRQHFEIPALLVGLGGAAAAAAGAPAGVALGTGATVAGLNGAKTYYAPRDKLPILAASVDALVCIKSASAGVDPYGSSLITQTAKPDDKGSVPSKPSSDTSQGAALAINATDQYYDLIETALLEVENIAAQRLTSVGKYSPDALMTEFEALQKKTPAAPSSAEVAKADSTAQAIVAAPGTTIPATTTTTVSDGKSSATVTARPEAVAALQSLSGGIDVDTKTFKALLRPGAALALDTNGAASAVVISDAERKAQADRTAVSETLIYIGLLQPKLEKCILRAKL